MTDFSPALRSETPQPRYAVIFRTHFWDDFAKRQFGRVCARVKRGDVFVMVDETRGAVAGIDHDRVVRTTGSDAVAMGLASRGEENLIWFNGDYPLYIMLARHPDYDYYVQLEYDVALNTDVDDLVSRVAADGADFVGLTKGPALEHWHWRHTCADAYAASETRHQLICFCIFSKAALEHLRARRLAMSATLNEDQAWPFCEAFIPTEMELAGMRSVELSTYVDTSAYDHWPPYVEADLPALASGALIHPVLDQPRYVASMMKYKVGLAGYLNPRSVFHRKLRRLSAWDYAKILVSLFAVKAKERLRARGPVRA